MRPLKRHSVHKGKASRKFSKGAGRTKAANVQAGPMRGGIRL